MALGLTGTCVCIWHPQSWPGQGWGSLSQGDGLMGFEHTHPPHPKPPEAHSPMGCLQEGLMRCCLCLWLLQHVSLHVVFPPALLQHWVLLLKLEGAAWTAPRCLCI